MSVRGWGKTNPIVRARPRLALCRLRPCRRLPRRQRCDKERTSVYYQVVSKPAQTLPPAGKVLVSAIEYKSAALDGGGGGSGKEAVSGLDLALE